MTIEEALELLPCKIVVKNDNPIDELDEEYWYWLLLEKNEDGYDLSYYSGIKDESLVSFSGDLSHVVHNMLYWYLNGHRVKETYLAFNEDIV